MENISVKISNELGIFMNGNTYNFYSTDKFIYIIFDKIPHCNLVGKFINVITNNNFEIPLDICNLKKGINKFLKPFCTVPVISLYESNLINKWKLIIYDCSSESYPIAEFNLNLKINSNYSNNGKSAFSKNNYCGIFFECFV